MMRIFPAVAIGAFLLMGLGGGVLGCSSLQGREEARERGLSEGAEVIRTSERWGEEAAAGDWESIMGSEVLCGLEEVDASDLSALYEEEVPRGSWENLERESEGDQRCGDDYETLLFRLSNCERAARGLAELSCDRRLVWAGRAHSTDMIEKDYFSHIDQDGRTPGGRLQARGLHFQRTGENLALAPTMALAHRGWMNSPGHRETILDENFTHFGVGVVRSDLGYVLTGLFSRDF